MLGAAIGKSNRVAASSGISVTVFAGRESSLRVIILDSVSILVYSWSFIGWFMVRGWLVVSWSWMGNWLVYNWGNIWSWLVYNWGWSVIRSWLMYNWGNVWSWFVYYWGMIRSWFVDNWGMVWSWGWVIDWGMNLSVMNWGWVVWGSMMDWGVSVCWGVDWDMSWGVDSSAVLFSSIRIVYVLWSSMGLASNDSMVGSMRFVDGMAYGWGIAVFDYLMARLISQGNGEKRSDCNKSL